ncbi:Cell growth-regulating nucleolar protein [Lamellibrachia satsuma]|nr:Cell growth-regulating nucleolar protein [Lamellibrachia satsuma]
MCRPVPPSPVPPSPRPPVPPSPRPPVSPSPRLPVPSIPVRDTLNEGIMVVFACGSCGDPLKKNQVEKHCQFKCKKCDVLSCIDCGKDFWGDSYKEHTKCISEEEKYSGKDFKPRPGANKGEVKQEAWFQQVQQAIDSVNSSDHRLKELLERLKEFPNIPRKKAKFENFVKNSVRVGNVALVTQAWDAISASLSNSVSI